MAGSMDGSSEVGVLGPLESNTSLDTFVLQIAYTTFWFIE